MFKWKQFKVFTILGLLLTILIGCSTPTLNSGTTNIKEIEFWTIQLQPQFTNYFNQLIARFEADNPGLSVRWVDVPWSAMESKVESAILAKTLPDIVNLNSNFSHLLTEPDAWLNLDNILSDSVINLYLPNLWQASKINSQSFGIPWYVTTNITIYNSELFKRAGVDKPPKTYVELAEVAKKIKETTGKYAFFTTFLPEESSEVLESFGKMGVTLVDAEGKAAFNTKAGQAVFQYWVDLYKDGLLPKEVLTKGVESGIAFYQAGETAMLFSGPELMEAIAENAPSVGGVSKPASQITGKTGKQGVVLMNLAISGNTKLPDLALKFALFITNTQNQLAFTQEANVLPSTTKVLENSFFQTVSSEGSVEERGRVISAGQMLKAEVLLPPVKDLNQLKQTIYEHLRAAMVGEKTVDRAIADAASQWNQISAPDK